MKLTSTSFFIKNASHSIVVLSMALVIASCHFEGGYKADSSSEKFRHMVDKINLLASQSKEYGVKITDSIYHLIPHPTLEDVCEKYLLKSYYFSYEPIYEEQYADSALAIIDNEGLQNSFSHLYGKACLYKGNALIAQRKFNDAYRYYYMGIKAVEGTRDTFDLIANMGVICYNQGNYKTASRYFKECFNEENNINERGGDFTNFQNMQRNLDNVGLCFDRSGMPDSAIFYYNKALDVIAQNESKFKSRKDAKGSINEARGVIYGNLGTALLHKNDDSDAEVFFMKSIRMNARKGGDIPDARLTEVKLAGLYLKTLRLKRADTVLRTLKTSFDTDKYVSDDVRMSWYKLESEYCNLSNQPQKVYKYLTAYINMKDSADKANGKLTGIDFGKMFDNIKQQDSFVALKEEDKIKNVNNLVAIIFFAILIGVAVFISRNNRELKLLNKKFVQQNKEMQHALVALEQSHNENAGMMEVLAYGLYDPLSAIKSMSESLLEDGKNKPAPKEFVGLIQASSSALLGMVTDALSAGITSQSISKEAVDMKMLLYYCVDLLRFKAESKKQDIHIQADDITLEIDREKIWRVLSNLISNAIKFSPGNSIIEVEMFEKQGGVRISVKDYGPAIPDDAKDKIFSMFSNAKIRTEGRGEHSFVIGLSISKQIVEILGGKIWVESMEGQGTTFYVEFPDSMIVMQ